MAVSKYHTTADIMQAYQAGQRAFGESRVQELCAKHDELPQDIEWHFIGHLQTNKVKYIAPFISLIHAVDTISLLGEIDRQAQRHDRTIPCLLQVHIAQEPTKYGMQPADLIRLLEDGQWRTMTHAHITGIMAMATNTTDTMQIQAEFHTVSQLFQQVRAQYFSQDPTFRTLSMGMTADYPIAISQGSTMVRIGSKIFN